jgi:hypothetical protein
MPSLTLTIQYAKNSSAILSSTELQQLYLTGITLEDQYGNPIDQSTIEFHIEAAQKEIQDYLSVKMMRMAYRENRDYMYDDWIKWGYMPTTYPVVTPVSLQGFLNTTLQIDYPNQWLSAKKQSPDEDLYHRNISLVPVQGASTSAIAGQTVYVGIAPLIGYWGNKNVPNYWEMIYITGFLKPPADILNMIGRMAATNLLLVIGDIIAGVPGLASKSVGIDGLSQSVTTTASSGKTTFSGRIDAWRKEMDRQLPLLKARYCGFTFGVLG